MTNFAQMMIANSLAASKAPAQQIARAKQAQTQAKAKTAKPKAKTIAASIIAGLQAGTSPQDVLKKVLKKHKEAKTTIACVYWYKSRMNRGLIAK